MIVSVASGKGGTGKTTLSAALAALWDGPVTAVDLDVEEPNLHLFLRPAIDGQETAHIMVPVVDEARCNRCRACSELCQFKAIAFMGEVILTFPDTCHGCGGCLEICPEQAVSAGRRELGEISWGQAGSIGFITGRLRVGEAMSPPLMRLVKARLQDRLAATGGDAIIDAPPGVSCPAVNAVLDSDVIVLVTEPTPFGFYDFRLAWEAFTPLNKPLAAVINRAGLGNDNIYRFCRDQGLPVVAEIPYERAIAEAYARGRIITEVSPGARQTLAALPDRLRGLAGLPDARKTVHA